MTFKIVLFFLDLLLGAMYAFLANKYKSKALTICAVCFLAIAVVNLYSLVTM